MLRSLPLVPLALATLAYAHTPVARTPGVRSWYHPPDHPVHNLFRRITTDGETYEEVGSEAWAAAFPESTPDANSMPQAWKDALKAAVDAGKIPDIPPSDASSGSPVYPAGYDPEGPEVCSATYKCRIEGDIWDAPDNVLGLGFDDGPWLGTNKLADFLEQNHEHATHFVIGLNVRNRPDEFKRLLDIGGDIAVHTYTHRQLTTLSNEEIVAELGWTMEIIRSSTGGRLPMNYRAPTGDMDRRVWAIAKEIFGLKVIMWNQDTWDWQLSTGGTDIPTIKEKLDKWISGPKSPGLIILEHELSEDTVQIFIDAYPSMKSNGWELKSQALLAAESAWQNSDGLGDDSTVTPASVILVGHSPDDNGGDNDDGGASPSENQTGSSSSTATHTSSRSSSTPTSGDLSSSGNADGALSTAWNVSLASFMMFAMLAILS